MIRKDKIRVIVTVDKKYYDIVKEYCDLKHETLSQFVNYEWSINVTWLPGLIKKYKKGLIK